MFLNEHQSKELFEKAGISVPQGILLTPGNLAVPSSIPAPWYLKAQVLTGGRGKAGGIVRADTPETFMHAARKLFGMRIKGHAVPFLRVESATAIRRECYLSFVLSRQRRELLLTVSRAGGMDVETSSDAVRPFVQRVPLAVSGALLRDHHLRAAFFALGVEKEWWPGFRDLVSSLYAAVRDNGLLLAEINPLVLTESGQWLALDGKVELDDNVVDLHPDTLGHYYTPEHHSREETLAREAGLSYVELSGWVGILVNGAGLAMATMDLLNYNGLTAANFMDLGGAADRQRMRRALDLLFANSQVRAVFINLFGGIVSCAEVARALLAVLGEERAPMPLVVRMAGFESAEGRALLQGAAHPDVHIATEMHEALDILRRLKPENVTTASFPRIEEQGAAKPVLPHSEQKGDLENAASAAGIALSAASGVLVQGITGKVAQRHVRLMQEYGTRIVAGVTPFKGGGEVLGVPVYDSVHEACLHHDIAVSVVFVPAAAASDAVLEAAGESIPWVVCITEGIPQAQMLAALNAIPPSRTRVVGPNTPGIIVPGQLKAGIMPGNVFSPGHVAVFSRSGTLTYEACSRLSAAGIGQSISVGIGGDSFIGTDFTALCECVRHDVNTHAVLVLGEVGGSAEEELAAYVLRTGFAKPVISFVAARTAPPGKRLGHAGAILDERSGGVEGKLQSMRDAGFVICPDLSRLPALVGAVLA